MSQRLRVVGWLRFGNKAQLSKGLNGFAANEAPGYFESGNWDVDGLDAWLRIDSELPGDFDNVERAFIAMFSAAKFGYVDYFEDGNTRIYGGHKGPLKRWARAFAKQWIFPEGTMGLGWPAADATIVLGGSVDFADEKSAAAIKAQLPLRLPFLLEDGVRELRLGDDVIKVEGKTVALAARVTGPANVLEDAIVEALAAISAKAKSGVFTMHGPRGRFDVKAGGKRTFAAVREAAPDNSFPAIAPVDPSSPLPAKAEKAGDKKKKSAAEPPLLEGHAKVTGAKRLPSGRIAVWGGAVMTIYTPELAPLHSFPLKSSDDDFAWPVSDVFELGPSRFAVTRESWSEVDLLDLETRTREVLRTPHSSVSRAHVLGQLLVTIGHGGVAVYDWLEEKARFDVGDSLTSILVLPDKTAIAASLESASTWSLETGKKIADIEKKTDVHVLSDGTWLLENYGKFGTFTADDGFSHQIVEIDPKTLAVFSTHRRAFHLVDRPSNKTREIDTKHKKDLGAIVRVGTHWVTHARSMPGLNERFGFDGVLKQWNDDWTLAGELDTKSPIRCAIPLGGEIVALLFDDAVRSKEIQIVEGTKLRATLKAKKPMAGALALNDGRLLYWSKDGVARIAPR